MSMWMIFAFLTNFAVLEVTLSEKRMPIATTTSAELMPMFDAFVPCMPIMPV